jgi:uncharacterized protein YndB with AHSA1/START domain
MAAGKHAESRNQTAMELKADREIIITRTFNAPARIVFDAWTKAELVRRWWAPHSRGVEMASCEADVRPGGKYRYVLRQGSQELGFSGEYREVTPHTRLVYTQLFEPMMSAGAVVCTVTFEERNGQTHLTAQEVYPSKEARQATITAGMEGGMRETMEQLEELLASLPR